MSLLMKLIAIMKNERLGVAMNAFPAVISVSNTRTLVTPEVICTTMTRMFPSGMRVGLVFEVPRTIKKKQLVDCARELNSLHVPQKVIATVTNMSQSYVSKLLRK